MFAKIFRKEWNELLSSAKFRWSTIVFLLLLAMGLANGIGYYHTEFKRRNEAAAATYRQWLQQGEKNPHSAAHYGFYAYKPVSPLSVFDKGLDDYLGNAVWLEAHNQNETKGRTITDKLSLSRFGDLTAGLLFIYIVPLLVLLLGFNMVSTEKENGTMRMLLSTRVSAKQVVWGKATALLAISTIWLVTAIIASGIILWVLDAGELASAWGQLLVIGFFLWLIMAIVSFGVTALSALSRQSSTSLVAGVAVWIAAAIVVPRLIGTAAEIWHPAPTAFSFQQAVDFDKENGLDGHDPANDRSKKFMEKVLTQYGVKDISQLPVNFSGLSLQAGEEEGNMIYDKHFFALHGILRQQDKTISLLAGLSPLAAGRNLVHGLAETDLNRHTLFINEAEQHRRFIQQLLNDDYAKGGAGKTTYTRDKTLWQQVNNFELPDTNTRKILQQQALNILVLMAWLAITIALLMYSARQLKPF